MAQSPAWDPLSSANLTNRLPTAECKKRIRRDMRDLMRDPLPNVFVVRDEELATVVHAVVTGPVDTPYELGFFWFVINCPDDYPNTPPKVKLMTTGGGTTRFNPNLYRNGKVCLSILGTWSGPGWTPVQSLATVLVSIQSLMCERPYHNEPGFERARGPRDVENYNNIIRFETLRVAVCDMVGDSALARTMPPPLLHTCRELFVSCFDVYVLACEGFLDRGMDGQLMQDPFGEHRGRLNFSSLLGMLHERRHFVAAVLEREAAEDEQEAGAPAQALLPDGAQEAPAGGAGRAGGAPDEPLSAEAGRAADPRAAGSTPPSPPPTTATPPTPTPPPTAATPPALATDATAT